MPYKNPEDKQKWEREHREQRNARRRIQGARSARIVAKPAHDPISDQEPSTWKSILGWAVGIGVVLLVAIGGINPPASPLARR